MLFCLHAKAQDFQLLNVFVEEQIVEFAVDELELDAQLATMFNYDVRMYRASYDMPFLGDQIGVSGAVFIPVQENSNTEHPIVVFNHGTIVKKNAVGAIINRQKYCKKMGLRLIKKWINRL